MRRLLLAAACGLASLIAVPTTSGASTAPTIAGPYQARYEATVTLTGTTPAPNERVVLYFRDANQTSFTPHRDLVSDASGRYSTTYLAYATKYYFARSGGVNSAIHATRLLGSACVVGPTLFRPNPIPTDFPTDMQFAALTYSRNGVWAGYAYNFDPLEFDVITWRPGQHTATVLSRTRYTGSQDVQARMDGNVVIAGITPRGAVIAAVHRSEYGTRYFRYWGYAYLDGHTYALPRAANWTSVEPVGVADNGTIYGLARAAGHLYAVSWASKRSPYRVLMSLQPDQDQLGVDARGDLVYSSADGITRVRFTDGRVRALTTRYGTAGVPGIFRVSGMRVFGDTQDGILAWDLTTVPSGTTISPAARLSPEQQTDVIAAGRQGDVVTLTRLPALTTWSGGRGTLPDYATANGYPAGVAIGDDGRVAETLPHDGLPHFVTCR